MKGARDPAVKFESLEFERVPGKENEEADLLPRVAHEKFKREG